MTNSAEREAFEAHIKTTAWYQVLSQAKDEDDEGASVFRMARMAADAAWQARAALLEPVGEGDAIEACRLLIEYDEDDHMDGVSSMQAYAEVLRKARAAIAASPKSNGGMGS